MTIRILALVALLSTVGFAQITGTTGAQFYPLGCPVPMTITNDTAATVNTGACYFSVNDAITGAPVYNPFICILIIIPISPGATYTGYWNQFDNSGNQVLPGIYNVTIQLPGGAPAATEVIQIGVPGITGTVSMLGGLRAGTSRNMEVCFPAAAGEIFSVFASLTASTGFPIPIPGCGNFPLDNDFLFQATLNPNPYLLNNFGNLNSSGRSFAPQFNVPAGLSVSGVTFNLCAVTINVLAPCPVSNISAVTQVTIL